MRTIPLGTVESVYESTGPSTVLRYNGINAAALNGVSAPGKSSGEVVKSIDALMVDQLPSGMDSQWTELTYLQLVGLARVLPPPASRRRRRGLRKLLARSP